MNRTILILLVTLCVFAAGCATERIVGGYTKVEITDNEVMKAADFAINAQSKAIPRPGKLQLLNILRAEQQVVAGTNYRLTLSVKQDGHARTAEAIVWLQPWRSKPYQLTSWNWK